MDPIEAAARQLVGVWCGVLPDVSVIEAMQALIDACKRMPEVGSGHVVIRPYVGPMDSGSTTATPWCPICAGWHVPGMGACSATYSGGSV